MVSTWYANSSQTTLIGPTAGSSFPGNDYALVRYDNAALSHPGGFTAANALYDGTKAIGITSGGSGNCRTGGTTFFQPVTEAASAYGVTVY
ncbi:streptogrisin B [Micromonospora olivasterospora]|uniref:Streptogrisin B n=1 Tax=Micromonospora olivasterospora TaxID=1880 RepID=A0A562I703_MICOL|nr:streptogrisin B [Micromonospora olivasterospora]